MQQKKPYPYQLTFLAFVKDRYKQLAHWPRSLRSPNLEATMCRTLHNMETFTIDTTEARHVSGNETD
jgi:hypothetical protein